MTINEIKTILDNAHDIVDTIVINDDYSTAYRNLYEALGLLNLYEQYKISGIGSYSFLHFIRNTKKNFFDLQNINTEMLQEYLEIIA